MKRNVRQCVVGVLGLAVATAGAGLWAGSRIESADQAAAHAAPPARQPIVATVEHRPIEATVIARGTITAATRLAVRAPRVPDGAMPIVTGVAVSPGDAVDLDAGTLLFEMAGRPSFALEGDTTLYRDLRPGDEGPDVAALQRALAAAGFGPPSADGTYGATTAAAVSRFYRASGYEPRLAEPDGAGSLAAAAAARDAAREVAAAVRVDAGGGDRSGLTGLVEAEAELVAAERRYDELARRSGAMVAFGEITFVPGGPAHVIAVAVQPGSEIGAEPPIQLALGEVQVVARVSTGMLAGLVEGLGGTADEELGGTSFPLAITSVGAVELDAETGERVHRVVCRPTVEVDASALDRSVRVRFVTGASAGPVLAVPLAAVSGGTDGGDHVVVRQAGGVERVVEVDVGITGGGWVEVVPSAGRVLTEGDLVVVGR